MGYSIYVSPPSQALPSIVEVTRKGCASAKTSESRLSRSPAPPASRRTWIPRTTPGEGGGKGGNGGGGGGEGEPHNPQLARRSTDRNHGARGGDDDDGAAAAQV